MYLKVVNRLFQRYLCDKKQEIASYGFKLELRPVNNLRNSFGSSNGLFEEASRRIIIAANSEPKFYIPVLAHEISHMVQCVTQTPIWQYNEDCLNKCHIFDWVEYKRDHRPKTVFNSIFSTQLMEQEADKLAVKDIKKYNLPLNIEQYIQFSNSYVLFYSLMFKYRLWATAKYASPYYIHKYMPKKFINYKDFNRLAEKYEDILCRYYYA